ncbi:MAG: hypothetical protein LBM02_06345 [Lachnospiraceae bacterium]|jgi:tetratricopeptide (TPR) repeat protein|nr:hypothetical protein [Lachnospiraceae bacterium]
MGSLILCHRKKAYHPYLITRLNLRVYSIEELCYFICNNLYFVDELVINRALADWLDDELDLSKLADTVRNSLDNEIEVEEIAVSILEGSNIYTVSEVNKMRSLFELLMKQQPIERQRIKADNLVKIGKTEDAILIYQEMLDGEWNTKVPKEFYGKIYGSLGAAYGKNFLYIEAARMYKEAYSLTNKQDYLKAYVYSCFRYMSKDKYSKFLAGNSEYSKMNDIIKDEIKEIHKEVSKDIPDGYFSKERRTVRGVDKTINPMLK